ncbi:MAG TPA: alpha/beta hydrolase, partial [Puia sp.]|nr:alpha/beta hydrolase [Puia sp.]
VSNIDGKKTFFLLLFVFPSSLFGQGNVINLGKSDKRPLMFVYRPIHKMTATLSAVIVCSGGSYRHTADEVEGEPAANLLAANGITAFLLDYRIPDGRDSMPLADAQKAIRYVKEHAKEYHVRPDRIGIMGFSAGGHLASSVGTHWRNSYDTSNTLISDRPDFMVLVYPLISFADSLTHILSRSNFLGNDLRSESIREFSNELQVKDDTPPTFIVAALDDDVVKVENSLYFEAALRQHHVPAEIFLYAKGGHGFGIYNETASVQWTDACINWIRKL